MGERISEEQLLACSKIAAKHGSTVAFDEPMSRHTSFRIGGCCDLFIEINSRDALRELIMYICSEGLPYSVIGRGSNLLVSDGCIHRVILSMGSDYADISVSADGMIYCQAGAVLSSVCIAARNSSLSGLEFAYGIPGRIGGAVYMNAGAYGGEMKDIVVYADAMDEKGNMHRFTADELKFGYRKSVFCEGGYIITDVSMKLVKGGAEIGEKMDELMKKRRDKQPVEFPSAGSTFKRPEGAFAAALIEECGLKGKSVGGAKVSEKHSGFVINTGNATFADVMELIGIVRDTVKEKTGYVLECEPVIIE
ncbi:MAG: UDP-N-acetylmuramate dehydrogenase [Huintestinicola sp.]